MKINDFPYDLGDLAEFKFGGNVVRGRVSDFLYEDDMDDNKESVVLLNSDGMYVQYELEDVTI